jgi:VWFA-related protein
MLRGLLLSVVGFCASIGLAQPHAESGLPKKLVRLSVAATNVQGEPVADLLPADIQVLEDGKPRPVVFFRFAGSRRSVEPPGVGDFINRPGPIPTVILFDRWNERMLTSARAWTELSAALQHLESVNQIYIYFLTGSGELFPVQPLPLTSADVRIGPEQSAADLRDKLDRAVRQFQGLRAVDAVDPALRASKTFQALGALGAQMTPIPGRKNFIWITHGIPLNYDRPPYQIDLTPQMRSLSDSAAQYQIAIYTVDQSAEGAGADLVGQSRATLRMISALTGGRWFGSDDVDAGLTGSLQDARGIYTVAYYSAVREKDAPDKEHKIRVESKRKEVHFLTREGYFGQITEPDPAKVEDAMFSGQIRSPFDAVEIGLRVHVARDTTNRAAGKVGHFTIRIDPRDVFLERRGENYHGQFGLMFAFYTGDFLEERSTPTELAIDLTPDQFNHALKDGAVVSKDVPVSERVQKIRVMVSDRVLHALGSVTIPIDTAR